jgi:hypothetical protein
VPWAPAFVVGQVAICLALLASFVAGNPAALAIDAGALSLGFACYVFLRWRSARGPR